MLKINPDWAPHINLDELQSRIEAKELELYNLKLLWWQVTKPFTPSKAV